MTHSTHDDMNEATRLRRAFVPSLAEFILLVLGSLISLVLLNVLPAVRSVGGTNYLLAVEYMQSWVERLLAPTNNQQASQVLSIVFWVVIGIIVYVIVWLLITQLKNYRSDVVGTKGMVVPNSKQSLPALSESVARILVRILSTLLFLYWQYLFFAAILPYASDLTLRGFTSMDIVSVWYVASATFIVAGSVFMTFVFARCVVLRERVFSW